jgi:uncharacterized RDD family membrane protein YckC
VTQPPGQPAYPALPPYPAPPPYYRPLPPAPMSPGGQPLADFGTRLLAYLIDTAIITVVAVVVFVPALMIFVFRQVADLESTYEGTGMVEPDLGDLLGPLLLLQLGMFLLLLVAYYVYYVEMMYRSGQTVGKKVMKIRVVPADPAKRTLTRGMAAKRYLVEIVAGLFLPLFTYLDGLWQLWDEPYQQTLHDKAAQTVVVKVAP